MEIFGIMLLVKLVCGMDNILNLNQGKIKGSILKSRNGREFREYQGINYSKPPVGASDYRYLKHNLYVMKFKICFYFSSYLFLGIGFSAIHGGLSLYGLHYLLDKDIVVTSYILKMVR